jgi:hypothetical protein
MLRFGAIFTIELVELWCFEKKYNNFYLIVVIVVFLNLINVLSQNKPVLDRFLFFSNIIPKRIKNVLNSSILWQIFGIKSINLL